MSLEQDGDELAALRRAMAPRLRDARKRAGVTQEELATRAGVGRVIVANIETGRSLPSLTKYAAICHALGVDPGPLLRAPACTACGDAPPAGFTCNACGSVPKEQTA